MQATNRSTVKTFRGATEPSQPDLPLWTRPPPNPSPDLVRTWFWNQIRKEKKNTKINFLGPETPQWGGGLPREGVVAEKLVPSLESLSSSGFEEKDLGCPENMPGCPGPLGVFKRVFKKYVQKKFVRIFRSLSGPALYEKRPLSLWPDFQPQTPYPARPNTLSNPPLEEPISSRFWPFLTKIGRKRSKMTKNDQKSTPEFGPKWTLIRRTFPL